MKHYEELCSRVDASDVFGWQFRNSENPIYNHPLLETNPFYLKILKIYHTKEKWHQPSLMNFPFLCWFRPRVTDTTSAHSLLMKTSHFPNLIIEETGKCMSFPLCSRKETGWHRSSQILQHYTLKIASTISWCQYSKRYFQFFQYRRNSC